MSVSGRIAVDLEFTDRTSTAGGSSLNTITLRDATEYSTGKVAIVRGTVGTTRVTINPASLTYIDAAGSTVAFTSVRRIALKAEGQPVALLRGPLSSNFSGFSVNDLLVVSESLTGQLVNGTYGLVASGGTASYTLVIYGS